MNVNEKGVKGMLRVMDDLQDKGYYLFPAFDDHSPVDLVAMDRNGKIFRLQVKYRQKDPRKKSERYEVPTTSVVNGKKIPINRDILDGWAMYLVDANKIVYINKKMLEGKNSLTIDPGKEYGELAEW